MKMDDDGYFTFQGWWLVIPLGIAFLIGVRVGVWYATGAW